MPQKIEFEDPFTPMSISMATFDPNGAQQLLINITNSLTAMYQKSNDNRQQIIKLGSKPKSAEGYDAINSERYDIENKIDSLKKKWDTVSQILYWKSCEMRHWAKAE
jgi:hypothetical protein